MEFLNIPEQLKGKWKNALFLTYNIDLSFFEKTLLREFYKVCRNIIILADGTNYLEACKQHKRSQLLHYVNTNYVVEGIYNTNLSHAKLIFLTNETEGKLILGSGNLGLHGYSRNGEIFKVYEYKKSFEDEIEVFIIIKNFIEQLVEKKYLVNNETINKIRLLFESSPWLSRKNINKNVPVIHNLESNLIEQFKNIIMDREVEHLVIHSPFYDKDMNALENLLDTFKPKKVNLLIQDKYTSLDPAVLEKIILRNKSRLFFNKINTKNRYVHAKIYLIKLKNSSICIIGSPNLTKNALIKKPPAGNIEIASVLMGKKNEFNELINFLEIGKDESDLSKFILSYKATNDENYKKEEFNLLSGSWEGKKLILYFSGNFPNGKNIFLNIDNNQFKITKYEYLENSIVLSLDEKVIELLHISPPNPVILEWRSDDEINCSNPIFVQNIRSLKNFLNIDESIDKLDLLEKVHLEKPEIIDLLKSLNKNLVINDESLWKVSNKANTTDDLEDEEDIAMDYKDINYDEIYKSKEYLQYRSKIEKKLYLEPLSPVQIFLNSINKHFEKISNIQKYLNDSKRTEDEEKNYGNEEEAEVREEEKKRRSLREDTRLKIIFNNFIKKFLKGINSKNFQKMVDFEIMVKNYMIFNHLILRLFDEEWTEKSFLVKSFLKIWSFFWGKNDKIGYLESLESDEKNTTTKLLNKYRSKSQLLAGLNKSIQYINSNEDINLLLELRDFLRYLLINENFKISKKIMNDTYNYISLKGLNEKEIIEDFLNNINYCGIYESRNSFLGQIKKYGDLKIINCNFSKVNVSRDVYHGGESVNCIIINSKKFLNHNNLFNILKEWMRFDKLDYYRIEENNFKTGIFYDKREGIGKYWKENNIGFKTKNIEKIKIELKPYELEIKKMKKFL
ncbi:MAG: hypothetical protein HQ569_08585 [Actinobacteria bacterium]|nr:hypothetical protein [Actinomycetota bacterium]